jgi:hypothetical protein
VEGGGLVVYREGMVALVSTDGYAESWNNSVEGDGMVV